MREWASLRNHREMVEATQLSERQVQSMSTEQLADAVLTYPLLPAALAFNSVQGGFNVVARDFNGLQEFLHRPDAGGALVRRYEKFDASVPTGATTLQAGNRALAGWRLEIVLAQPEILSALSTRDAAALARVAEATLAVRQRHANVYSALSLEPAITVLGRQSAIREGRDWSRPALLRDATTSETGTQASYEYIKTPNGTSIQVWRRGELSSSEISGLNAESDRIWPNATRETSASQRYNCHSYAWYSTTHSSNNYWMNRWWEDRSQGIYYPNVSRYWTDGSYKKWSPPLTYFSGMRWVYWTSEPWNEKKPSDHSGIEVGTTGNLRSKWGPYGRMYHRWDYTPGYALTDIRKYYR
jgi:hypothetical protein